MLGELPCSPSGGLRQRQLDLLANGVRGCRGCCLPGRRRHGRRASVCCRSQPGPWTYGVTFEAATAGGLQVTGLCLEEVEACDQLIRFLKEVGPRLPGSLGTPAYFGVLRRGRLPLSVEQSLYIVADVQHDWVAFQACLHSLGELVQIWVITLDDFLSCASSLGSCPASAGPGSNLAVSSCQTPFPFPSLVPNGLGPPGVIQGSELLGSASFLPAPNTRIGGSGTWAVGHICGTPLSVCPFIGAARWRCSPVSFPSSTPAFPSGLGPPCFLRGFNQPGVAFFLPAPNTRIGGSGTWAVGSLQKHLAFQVPFKLVLQGSAPACALGHLVCGPDVPSCAIPQSSRFPFPSGLGPFGFLGVSSCPGVASFLPAPNTRIGGSGTWAVGGLQAFRTLFFNRRVIFWITLAVSALVFLCQSFFAGQETRDCQQHFLWLLRARTDFRLPCSFAGCGADSGVAGVGCLLLLTGFVLSIGAPPDETWIMQQAISRFIGGDPGIWMLATAAVAARAILVIFVQRAGRTCGVGSTGGYAPLIALLLSRLGTPGNSLVFPVLMLPLHMHACVRAPASPLCTHPLKSETPDGRKLWNGRS